MTYCQAQSPKAIPFLLSASLNELDYNNCIQLSMALHTVLGRIYSMHSTKIMNKYTLAHTLCVTHTHTFTHICTHEHTHVCYILCVNIHTYVSLICTGPPETSPTTDASLVSDMHATTSITITTTQKSSALDTSQTVPHDSTKTELDSASLMSSDIQLVYSTAMASPVSIHVTTTGKASSHTLKNIIVVKPSTTMMTSAAMTTTTSMVSPSKKSSQVLQNSVSSLLSSTVTPMVSSSTPQPSKVVTATTSSLVLLVYVSTRVAIADGEPCLTV